MSMSTRLRGDPLPGAAGGSEPPDRRPATRTVAATLPGRRQEHAPRRPANASPRLRSPRHWEAGVPAGSERTSLPLQFQIPLQPPRRLEERHRSQAIDAVSLSPLDRQQECPWCCAPGVPRHRRTTSSSSGRTVVDVTASSSASSAWQLRHRRTCKAAAACSSAPSAPSAYRPSCSIERHSAARSQSRSQDFIFHRLTAASAFVWR